MLYAKIALGLPVEGPFDYIVPDTLKQKIAVGKRVWIDFRNQKQLGYVVELSCTTKIKKLKNILEVIDDYPVLTKNMFLLAEKISESYCCSLGQALDTVLPQALRKGRRLPPIQAYPDANHVDAGDAKKILLHDLDKQSRWNFYLEEIKQVLSSNKSVIFLLPDKDSLTAASKNFNPLGKDLSLAILYRNAPDEFQEWLKVKNEVIDLVIGTRSAIFAPLNNLGLIIIEKEEDSAFKQDRVPHYHARDVAILRADIDRVKLILGSDTVSLESYYLAKKGRLKIIFNPKTVNPAQIQLVDTKYLIYAKKKQNIIFAKILEDAIYTALNAKNKILLFLNRKGFATTAVCLSCAEILKCPRCSINLVYYSKQNVLKCQHCNFKIEAAHICPKCNSGYIKFTGVGIERIESELSRIFPQAKVKSWDNYGKKASEDTDIFVATSAVIKESSLKFDLIGVLGIDNALNRLDLRAAEKAFNLLAGLLGLAKKTMLIQTAIPHHHCFSALLKNDMHFFYEQELKERRQLSLPPYRHLVLVKLRGLKKEKVRDAGLRLFAALGINSAKHRWIKLLSVNPAQPPALRGNFYWQILISSLNPEKASEFLKIRLKDFSHSGIIVTVDVDPV